MVGPEGDEIFTDEHGRVRVQFPWDREGAFDEKSSCWLRVSQPAAGAGFGTVSVPRVGQEVLVGFLGGDPDHPLVVGRVFNATAPLPYAFPEHKTRTSLRSNSSPGGAGANEITFDDKAGGELFYMQAQGDLHKIVKQNELESTAGNRHLSVDGDLVLSAKGKVIIHAGDEVIVKGGPNVKINPGAEPAPAEKPRELATAASVKKPPPAHAPSSAAKLNEALGQMHTGPMPVSDQTAALRKKLAEKYQAMAIKLGEKYHVPPALILGLMSRESGFGTLLAADGTGDHGHGFGILQVDDRSHVAVGGPYSYQAADQAVGIFSSGLASVKAAHPHWTSDQQLAGAVAAYNAGAGNVATQPTNPSTWAQMDVEHQFPEQLLARYVGPVAVVRQQPEVVTTMQPASRRGDLCTGHDDCSGRPASQGSPDVSLNDRPALRVDDALVAHGCTAHKPHPGKVAAGSSTVTFNDKPAARVADPVDCGSEMRTGSPDVLIGG